MEREIKFRAWLSGKHGSLRFSESRMEYNAPIIKGKWADIESGWDIHGLYDTIPLMQYAGLKDKNGKDIYEGDIVRFTDWINGEMMNLNGVVGFENGSFVIKSDIMIYYRWIDYEVEVVGNIYETPELLK